MSPARIAILIAAALFVTPALAGAAPAPQLAQASPDAGADDDAVPAPVPDPFLAEVLKACRDGASGDRGTLARLTDDGWSPGVDPDTQTPFFQSFSGQKDFDGVGTAAITFSQEVYPTMTEGYCSVSIDTALRRIGIADMGKMADLVGQLREDSDGVASTWQVRGPNAMTFIQADQHDKDLYFILDVTTLVQKPAADLPYVKPANPDGDDMDDTPDQDDPAATNATNTN